MKAMLYTEYGPPEVLHLAEIPTPVPKDNEILVRVRATTVNYGDITARNFKAITPSKFNMPLPLWLPARLFSGFSKPRNPILGSEFSGEVAGAGKAVTRFRKGDPVYGYLGQRMGAYAEYLCMADDGSVAAKPSNLTFEEAATVPYGAIMVMALFRTVSIQPGQKVLVNGASGGLGSMAVQLARYYGADVTGVCGAPRMDYVKSLGASRVIDYAKEDFTRSGETFDLIFDILGKSTFERCKAVLAPDGRYLLASFKMRQVFQMLATSRRPGQKVICTLASERPEDLVFIRELIEAGKIKTIIDRCYPLEQAAEAHRYVEAGSKKGPVVLTV